MTNQNNAAQAAEQEIDAIMEQAQVFASAWAFFGGPFDQGDGKEQAEREEARLRDVIRNALSKLRSEGVPAGEDVADVVITPQQIRESWNSQADQYNQWGELDEDERLEWAIKQASAPVADIRIGVSATSQGATICIMQQHADGTATVIYSETHPLGDSLGRAALASAPVAGEAEIMAVVYEQCPDFDAAHEGPSEDDMISIARTLLARYATPQASEAVAQSSSFVADSNLQLWQGKDCEWPDCGCNPKNGLETCELKSGGKVNG